MSELKRLTPPGVEKALGKAERYRLLGEPCEAESICRDVLEVDPGNYRARLTLILALTDQFRQDLTRVPDAKRLVGELEDDYQRYYYSGVVAERHGKSQLQLSGPSSGDYANRKLREAMAWFARAEAIRPPGDDDAILRWNTCARTIARRGLPVPSDAPSAALLMTE